MIVTGKPRKDIPRDKLYHLYVEERLSGPKVAEIFGTTCGSIEYFLQKYEIKREDGIRLKIDKELFIQMYEDGVPMHIMADRLGCCYATVFAYVRRFRLKIRPNYHDDTDKAEILRSMYIDEKKSIGMIAKELGLPKSRIRTALIQCGIERRGKSESQQIYNNDYKTFGIDWAEVETPFNRRCRRYFRTHIASKISKEKCDDCGSTENLHLHHVKAFSIIIREIKNENPNLTEDELFDVIINDERFLDRSNLKVVCENCHYTKYHPYLKYKVANQKPSPEDGEGSTTIENEDESLGE